MVTIFTFGCGQRDPRTGRTLADRFVRVEADNLNQARHVMLERFGRTGYGGNWAFDYPDEYAAGVDTYGIIEIDFETGLDIGSKAGG